MARFRSTTFTFTICDYALHVTTLCVYDIHVIAANSRDINLKDVISYELSVEPFSLDHTDGSLKKNNKGVFMNELEKKVDVQLKLPQVVTSAISIAHIFDAIALVHVRVIWRINF